MKAFKSLLVLFVVLFSTSLINAQVGIGTTTPQGALDITSANDGLLIPRVALTNTTTVTVTTPVASEIVYNTAAINDVTPGFYYLLTAAGPWVRFGGTGWLTNGNTDIINGTSFMGTINDVDVPFRRFNTPAGRLALNSTSFGVGALASTTVGDNVAIGNNALNLNTGNQNVAIGIRALQNNTNGGANVGIGYEAMINNNANNNIGIGYHALRANVSSSNNTVIGFQALSNLNNAAASLNVAVGFQAMQNGNSAMVRNSFFGAEAGRNNTGNFNTGLGRGALGRGTSSGQNNTGVGHLALEDVSNGNENTAVGSESLWRVTSGRENTGLGYRAGGTLTTGTQNTFLGYQAASAVAIGSNNIAIGYQAQVAIAADSHQIKIGDGRILLAQTQIGWTLSSDKRLKSDIKNSSLGLDFIKTLRPVSYTRLNDKNHKTEYGFIAQELEEALVNVGDSNNGIIVKDDAGIYGVRYNDFIPMTIKAVQEQQILIEKLQKDNDELKATNAAILKRLDALEKRQ